MKIENIRNSCTGCTACANVCPVNCISMGFDNEGFYFPVIDHDKCVSCGKCEAICHCLNKCDISVDKSSYYGFTSDEKLRYESSSGGAFSEIADIVLKDGGNVYGAAFDYNDLYLKHMSTDEVDISLLRKSKYVESDLNDVFSKIQMDINKGRKVLFCGTPCQVSGLKHYIMDEKNLLITVDFICHGVPSAKLFKEHLGDVRKKRKVLKIDFRFSRWSDKKLELTMESKRKIIPYTLDTFYFGFMRYNAFLRRCCYDCKYRQIHYSDITIADFWGYRAINESINDEKGLSLIVANNDKGRRVIECFDDFHLTAIDNKYSDYAYSHRDYSEFLHVREKFYNLYNEYGFEKAAIKTFYKQGSFRRYLKYFVKKLIGREK